MRTGNSLVLLLLLLIPSLGFCQSLYWVGFPDKNRSEYSTEIPEKFLSKKAINRRAKQQIEITAEDLPVCNHYIDSVKKTGAEILFALKWLNGVVVRPTNEQLEAIKKTNLSFSVISIYEPLPRSTTLRGTNKLGLSNRTDFNHSYYGNGFDAVDLIKGPFLHQLGYKGQGKLIAIIDDGFYHANQLNLFADAFSNNRVIATKDFVNPTSNIFEEDSHGMHVFSVIGTNTPTKMVGTAPEANYLLLRSEDYNSEQLVEEYYWAAAAEYADSMGADIINTSLGYTTFDIPSQNHAYADLTGDVTPISKSCTIAASKGMIIVCSAGNEGNNAWKYISAPADAKGILTVGAVPIDSIPSSFTSIGPSADGRIKPEIVALGSRVGIIDDLGIPSQGNGTSYAAPIIAGMSACLWQAFPNLSANQIRQALISSASRYSNPTEKLGYGIPNTQLAYYNLLNESGESHCIEPEMYPNPVSGELRITLHNATAGEATIAIYSGSGVCVFRKQWLVTSSIDTTIQINANLSKGIYIAHLTCGACHWREKLVKQ
ncbi:S8 family serine peptidase [Williamwhitmania taraxaci]|uniref:Por secretion system C-terminal sorting domain-containing protein n=1 Tax=Williamwhitmania taraxaci TaxID=1640674 RepID=A0A1G6GQD7_9BACT|nr:S8 family serine peptidase [Williamwhitmania taraxaci]SDB84129.1 Por secretion system C-terminal sorting domain-containing protein [Williamwhitmania taraxaci]